MQQIWVFDKPITFDELYAEITATGVPHLIQIPAYQTAYAIVHLTEFNEWKPVATEQDQIALTARMRRGGSLTARGSQWVGMGPRPYLSIPPDITAQIDVVQIGDRLRLSIRIDDDPSLEFYATVHERWATLKQHLERYRGLIQYTEPVAGGEQLKAEQRPKRQLLHSNKWLIEQHLDHGRPLTTLIDEWLELRLTRDGKTSDLTNPVKSAHTVISEEKSRRRDRQE